MNAASGLADAGGAPAAPAARRGPRERAGLAVGVVVPVVAGAALWAAARSSTAAVVTVVAVLQATAIATWVLGLRVPGRIGALGVAAAVAAAVDVLAVQFPDGRLGVFLPPIGLVLLGVFVAQLARGVVRWRVVESVSDVSLVALAVVGLGTLVPLRHGLTGQAQLQAVAVVVGAALAVAAAVDLVAPVPRFDAAIDRGLAAVVVAGVVGGVLGHLLLRHTLGYGPTRGAVLGAALAVVAALIAVGAAFARYRPPATSGPPAVPPADGESEDDPVAEAVAPASRSSQRVQDVATALWAVAVTAPIGYLLTLALGG